MNNPFEIEGSTLVRCDKNAQGHIEIPNSVTKIEYKAFEGCTGLTSITIPNSVTWIGLYAFNDCTGLKEIHCRIEHLRYVEIDDFILDDVIPIFDNVNKHQVIVYVPSGTEDEYRRHSAFQGFKEIVEER